MGKTDVTQSMGTVTCAAALVASLAACGGGGDTKATPPTHPAGSTSATSGPATLPAKAVQTVLAPRSSNTYGGLKVVLNLPANIPPDARPTTLRFSTFLQSVGRTMAQNKLEPVVSATSTADVVKSVQSLIVKDSVAGTGTVTFKVRGIKTSATFGQALITGCFDRSKLVQVRKNRSHFVDANVKKHPTLTMTANIERGARGLRVTRFALVDGPC